MVKYPFWVQKLLHYTTQHEGDRHIDFQHMSISPAQTMANNCKTAFSPVARPEGLEWGGGL